MKNSLRIILLPLVTALAIVLGIYIGRFVNPQPAEKQFIIYPRNDKLSNVVNYISDEYVDKIDRNELIEKVIPELVNELDPHTQYIPASELVRVNEPLQGNFSGIGVQFNMLDDTLVVIKTVANGPSEKVGILAGDRFITVDNDTVAGVKMPSDSIVNRLKGPKGTKVHVGVQRHNVDELVYFDITRDNIPLYSIDISYMLDTEIGYIRINKFARTTYEEFMHAVGQLQQKGMTKLVLDLRGNAGGYLDAAVNIIDQFLPANQLIVYTEGNAHERYNYMATDGGACLDTKLAVLIDEGSASASEILAGAIQDNDRGIIIGRRSFGKGLVQEQKVFSDGSALRLTIARYYTPTGRCIQKPYDNGSDDYYSEINERYYHGEFLEADSIQFADSLKYITPGGKTVYGGGGIMPDLFTPIDTSQYSDYLGKLRSKGIIYRFALEYVDNNRTKLEKLATPGDFEKYLSSKNLIVKDFIPYAKKQGVPFVAKDYAISKLLIETEVYAYIARNILDNEGFYPIIEKIDHTLQTAIEQLMNDVDALSYVELGN